VPFAIVIVSQQDGRPLVGSGRRFAGDARTECCFWLLGQNRHQTGSLLLLQTRTPVSKFVDTGII